MAAELAVAAAEAAAAAQAAGDQAALDQATAAAEEAAAHAQAAAAAAQAGCLQEEGHTQQQQQQQGSSRQLRERCVSAAPSAGAIAAGAVSIDPSRTGGRPVDCRCWYTEDVVVRLPGEAPHDLLKRINFGHLPYESREQVRWPARC
jgi:hypothetical protein